MQNNILRIRPSLVNLYSKWVGCILSIFGIIYLIFFNAKYIAAVSTISGILALTITPHITKHIYSIFFLYLCGLAVVFYSANDTGGILSPIIFWLTTTPMLVGFVFFYSRLIIFASILTFILVLFSFFISRQTSFSLDELAIAALFALSGITGFNGVVAYFFHKALWKEKKVIEAQMEQMKKLEAEVVQKEKMSTIGLLASGVAHQLGNTINVILTSTINMEMAHKKGKLEPEKLAKTLDRINKAAKLSNQIIEGLDYATKRNVENEKLSLKEVIDVAILLVSGANLEKISTKNQVGDDVYVFGSKSGLLQVFMNLMSNSIDAMLNGNIIFSSIKKEGFYYLTYSDDGPGIAKEIQQKLFAAFFTTKSADKGTGLGLYVAKQELEKMSGTIEYLHKEKGANFLIKIPGV